MKAVILGFQPIRIAVQKLGVFRKKLGILLIYSFLGLAFLRLFIRPFSFGFSNLNLASIICCWVAIVAV